MAVRKVGVIGCGLMGSGITQVCAQSGFETTVREVSQELIDRGLSRIKSFMEAGVKRGKLKEEDVTSTFRRIKSTTRYEDLADCDIVIEAVIENMDAKKEVFSTLDKLCRKDTIIASNTSSLSITEMASVTRRHDKCIGMHFFNPVPVMKLIEIVKPEITSEQTYQAVREMGQSLGKTVVTAKDTPGFIVNLLLVPYLLDAVRAVENGTATKEDVDTAVKLGLNHPMGPIELLDYVGLDTTYYIAEAMFQEFKDTRYASPTLLKRMVLAGRNGRKVGRGFYDYNSK
ncbi:MAG: 3-hydroxybutyryl-CoA dehydrogenase [Planctomycetes bacterium]|nr:3-hydroxybutyryl-CoA dehydrogenase [Planctomycetota bacterium]